MAIDPRQRQFNEMQNRMNGMTPGQAMNPNQRRFAEMQNRTTAAQAAGRPMNANQQQFAQAQNRVPTMNTLPVPQTPQTGGGLEYNQPKPFMPPPSPYEPDGGMYQPPMPQAAPGQMQSQVMPQQQPMNRRDMEMANRIQGMPKQQMNANQRRFAEAQNRAPQGILTRPPTR